MLTGLPKESLENLGLPRKTKWNLREREKLKQKADKAAGDSAGVGNGGTRQVRMQPSGQQPKPGKEQAQRIMQLEEKLKLAKLENAACKKSA